MRFCEVYGAPRWSSLCSRCMVAVIAFEVKTNNGFTTPDELKGSKGDIKN